jgi:hypothetical protein
MPSASHLLHDDRDFAQWRDETAAAWETLASHADERAPLSANPKTHRRRARTLRKLAAMLRAEQP